MVLCKRCGADVGRLYPGRLCYSCYMWQKWYGKPVVGTCKLCGEKILDKDGTFVAGKGSCHEKCAREREEMLKEEEVK